jgi:hypothetical protein
MRARALNAQLEKLTGLIKRKIKPMTQRGAKSVGPGSKAGGVNAATKEGAAGL